MFASRTGSVVLYTLFFCVCACVVMPGYVRHAVDSAVPHHDVYFNMWRVSWFAHALRTSGASMWDGNIFSPERWTLAMSDAVPVESAVGTALLWLRLPPVLVHNCVIVGAMIGSALAVAWLARYLTGSPDAGAVAGVIFAFAPFRIEHLMHLEMQWAMWVPLTFLALHKTIETGRRSMGIAVGLCVGLQFLSSVYYGVFLATMLGIAVPMAVLLEATPVQRRSALVPLALATCVAGLVVAAYAVPYMRAQKIVGLRPPDEVAHYSARLRDYLAVPESNWLYEDALPKSRPERRLFVGEAAMLLAVFGLVVSRPERRQWLYGVLAVFAIAMSLGANGYLFSAAREWLMPYRGLRVPARFGIMTLFAVSVLAAYGYARVLSAWPKVRYALAVVVTGVLLLEYHVSLELTVFPNAPPPVYRLLASLPRGRVAEFPMPMPYSLPGTEASYQYMSTFHWNTMVNGYSGSYPPSYLRRLVELHGFPDNRAVAQLHRDGVSYVIVHVWRYADGTAAPILAGLEHLAWPRMGTFSDGEGDAVLYSVPR